MYILDTDHIALLQRRSEPHCSRLRARLKRQPKNSVFTTIVSFHEQAVGWNAYINRGGDIGQVVFGYRMLRLMLQDFSKAQVLPFDPDAARVFDSLRPKRTRIGTMDLRIAAIALSRDMTVLTRNAGDFGKVSGLRVEDWTT